jgi:hypothetical protein
VIFLQLLLKHRRKIPNFSSVNMTTIQHSYSYTSLTEVIDSLPNMRHVQSLPNMQKISLEIQNVRMKNPLVEKAAKAYIATTAAKAYIANTTTLTQHTSSSLDMSSRFSYVLKIVWFPFLSIRQGFSGLFKVMSTLFKHLVNDQEMIFGPQDFRDLPNEFPTSSMPILSTFSHTYRENSSNEFSLNG